MVGQQSIMNQKRCGEEPDVYQFEAQARISALDNEKHNENLN
jgi:hypothetical protein